MDNRFLRDPFIYDDETRVVHQPNRIMVMNFLQLIKWKRIIHGTAFGNIYVDRTLKIEYFRQFYSKV